jgi:hypothetical protein
MIWLRTWNPRWFVNPFYSPSVAGYVAGAKFIRDMMFGIEYATSFFSTLKSIQDAVDKKETSTEILAMNTNGVEDTVCNFCGAAIDTDSETQVNIVCSGIDMYIGGKMVLDDWIDHNYCCMEHFRAAIDEFISEKSRISGHKGDGNV